MNDTLNKRAEILLKALIQRYISDGQPVGSRTLARETQLDLSPATVRNVMADLEELGLIHAPHSSAGRVPTQLGYRLFVDSMIKVRQLDHAALEQMEGRLSGVRDPQELLASASDVLSQVTHFAGVVSLPRYQRSRFRQIEFLILGAGRVLAILVTDDGRVQNKVLSTDRAYTASELVAAANYFNARHSGASLNAVRRALLHEMESDSEKLNSIIRTAAEMAQGLFEVDDSRAGDMLLSGEENLFDVPDLCDLDKLRRIFDAFKTKQDLLELLAKSARAGGVSIFIGGESGYQALNDCSVVMAPYEAGGECVGVLGVVGPTRMSYENVIPVVDVTARLLGSALSYGEPGSGAS